MNINYRIPMPAVPFHPPVYLCYYTEREFQLDGRLDKDFWRDIPFTENFADIEGGIKPAPRFRTRAKLAWDKENLYIGAVLDGSEIWGTIDERDAVIFHDNDFEIFIDPDSDTQQYYEYEMNAKNTIWDLLLTKAYRDGGKPVNGFDFHGLRSAVHIDGRLNQPDAKNRFWSVEVVIPFAALGECAKENRSPVSGEYYRMNFSRVQWTVDVKDGQYTKRLADDGSILPEDNWVWAPTGVINIHYPELWAFVFFADQQDDADKFKIPENEYRAWELRKLYYAQHAVLDETGSFTEDIGVLKDALMRLAPCSENQTVTDLDYKIDTTFHSFELLCPDASGTGCLAVFSDGKTAHYKDCRRFT